MSKHCNRILELKLRLLEESYEKTFVVPHVFAQVLSCGSVAEKWCVSQWDLQKSTTKPLEGQSAPWNVRGGGR